MRKAIGFAVAALALAITGFGQMTSEKATISDGHASKLVVHDARTAESIRYDAGTARLLAAKDVTNGNWSLTELRELPGYKTPKHRHPDMDESFYVLDGVMTAMIGDTTFVFPAGSFVQIPRGTVHAQGNFGKAALRILLITAPGGFEQFFLERAELFKEVKLDDPEFPRRMTSVIEKNHIEVLGPWEPK